MFFLDPTLRYDPSLHNDPCGAHRAGGGKNRLGPWDKRPLGSGAHRAGGWKIRLGDFLLPGDGKIRLGPSDKMAL